MAEPIKRGVVGGLGKTALYTAGGALLGGVLALGLGAAVVGGIAAYMGASGLGIAASAILGGVVSAYFGGFAGLIGGGALGAVAGANKVYDDSAAYDQLKQGRAHNVAQNIAAAREDAVGQGAAMGYQQGFMEGQMALANQLQAAQAQQVAQEQHKPVAVKEDCHKCVSHVDKENARRAATAHAGHQVG